MFWVALSALIMTMTGAGDDTFLFRTFLENLQKGVEHEVKDPSRKAQALESIQRTQVGFAEHRAELSKIAACIEKNDRNYQATKQDYEKCLGSMVSIWERNVDKLIENQQTFRAALTDRERNAIRARLEEE